MNTRATVCVFFKAPIPGRVKTRLAPAVGERGAAQLAQAFFEDTLALVRQLTDVRVVLAVDGTLDSACRARIGDVEVWDQGFGDLGARLERVLDRALESSSFAIVIGTDAPALPLRLLERALRHLEHEDAVIGPSADGGFYLLGVRRCRSGMLAGIPWSTADTCARTVERLVEHGLHPEWLEASFDVDLPEDLARLREMLEHGDAHAPHTLRALQELGSAPLAVRLHRSISIVIPVLDEEKCLRQSLEHVTRLTGIDEIVVVDGGSTDLTLEIARGFKHVRVIEGVRGRGTQMNAGARIANGDVLLFLHADVELPHDVARCVEDALADPKVVAGAFRTQTVAETKHHGWTWHLALADLRSRFTRLPYGDQALFVRRDTFARVGGFPDAVLMEDLEIARRLRRVGKIARVDARVRVSGRRFLAHPIASFAAMNVFPTLYRIGVPGRTLARFYPKAR